MSEQASRTGLVTAINTNKYVTTINVATQRQTIEIDKPCQGLLLQMRGLENIDFKVDYIDHNHSKRSVIREMPLVAYLSFAQRFFPLAKVHKVDPDDEVTDEPQNVPELADEFVFILPFSLNGTLNFDDKNKYEVTFINRSENTLNLFYDLFETTVSGYPIGINKQLIRQVDMEKHIDLSTTDALIIDKFDTIAFQTPFGQSDQSIEMMRHLTNVVDSADNTLYARSYLSLESATFKSLTLRHSENNDYFIYLVDYIAPEVVLDNMGIATVRNSQTGKTIAQVSSADIVSNASKTGFASLEIVKAAQQQSLR